MDPYRTPTDDRPERPDEPHLQDTPAGARHDDPQPEMTTDSDRHHHEADDQSGADPGGAADSREAAHAPSGHRDRGSERPLQSSGSPGEQQYSSLLSDREAGVFLDRWREVQARFVDDPRTAVQDGDALVAELMQSLAHRFGEQKGALEEQWKSGGEPETEQLRLALQEYRSFFNRLLST